MKKIKLSELKKLIKEELSLLKESAVDESYFDDLMYFMGQKLRGILGWKPYVIKSNGIYKVEWDKGKARIFATPFVSMGEFIGDFIHYEYWNEDGDEVKNVQIPFRSAFKGENGRVAVRLI